MACNCEIYEVCKQCNPEGYRKEVARREAESLRRQQHPIRQTHTYAILEVSRGVFHYIQRKLEAAGVWNEYYDEHAQVINFGNVALKVGE